MLVTRLMQTIQADIAMSPDRTREQLETLNALRKLAAMPAASPRVSSRDGRPSARHHRVISSRPQGRESSPPAEAPEVRLNA